MKHEANSGLTYYAELNDEGLIDYPKENLLQINVGDSIIFHINAGAAIGKRARLRINMPELGKDNLYYKSTTSMHTLRKRPSVPKLNLMHAEERGLTRVQSRTRPFVGTEFEVHFKYPGSFFYQIEFFDPAINMMSKKRVANFRVDYTRPDWIVVHPKYETKHGEITSESMVIQTVICRCLGKLSRWSEVLGAQARLGYNAIHFVPMQKYGISGSMYCIKDQNSVDDWYVDDPSMPSEERLDLLRNVITEIREKHNLLCFADIVLNHTAVNSEWLMEHPESAYNLHNSPHLRVAWEFDKFLIAFSEAYAQRKVPECPYAPYVANETDLQALLAALSARIRTLPLGQYFLYNRERIHSRFDAFMAEQVDTLKNLDELKAERVDLADYVMKHSFGHGEKPFGVDVLYLKRDE